MIILKEVMMSAGNEVEKIQSLSYIALEVIDICPLENDRVIISFYNFYDKNIALTTDKLPSTKIDNKDYVVVILVKTNENDSVIYFPNKEENINFTFLIDNKYLKPFAPAFLTDPTKILVQDVSNHPDIPEWVKKQIGLAGLAGLF